MASRSLSIEGIASDGCGELVSLKSRRPTKQVRATTYCRLLPASCLLPTARRQRCPS